MWFSGKDGHCRVTKASQHTEVGDLDTIQAAPLFGIWGNRGLQ